jgi:hypothetical protein
MFLQQVGVEASVNDGQFEGFRIMRLQPENFWRAVDLQVGDIVVGINGQAIETEVQAFQALESLRIAPELRVYLLRAGKPRELRFPIVGAPAPKAVKDSQPLPTPPAMSDVPPPADDAEPAAKDPAPSPKNAKSGAKSAKAAKPTAK